MIALRRQSSSFFSADTKNVLIETEHLKAVKIIVLGKYTVYSPRIGNIINMHLVLVFMAYIGTPLCLNQYLSHHAHRYSSQQDNKKPSECAKAREAARCKDTVIIINIDEISFVSPEMLRITKEVLRHILCKNNKEFHVVSVTLMSYFFLFPPFPKGASTSALCCHNWPMHP